MPAIARQTKTSPHSQRLPHPIYKKDKSQVCLFVKDHKGEGHAEAKERHAKMQRTGIHKVIAERRQSMAKLSP